MNKKIYLSSPHMGGEEMEFIKEAFDSNWIAPLGENIDKFEKELSKHVGVKYATALSSGTSAIHLALKCLEINCGDVVFCSSLTFSATCNPIIYEGGTPVFIDSDYKTWNMSPIALQKAFDSTIEHNVIPKAVIVTNIYGQSADYDKIKKICDKYKVPIIEDAAESLGATYKGIQTGTIGDIGIYSFNGNKIITTSGGGMLVSNNNKYTQKALFWATQSRENERYYQHSEIGYNYRMSNIVAGIGRGQLKVLNTRINQKKQIYDTYKKAFEDIGGIEMMPIFEKPNYWLSTITLKKDCNIKPIDIILALEEHNIESRHVWKPMHLQPVFKEYDFFSALNDGSVSEDLFNRGICLPSDTKMSKADLDKVVEIIKYKTKIKVESI